MTAGSGDVTWPPADAEVRSVPVLGSSLAMVRAGPTRQVHEAPTLLFLHGNPTSSFLWRRVITSMMDTHRCIAVDLIGMGRSAKPPIEYTFADHSRFLEAYVDTVRLRDVVVVGHDWGAVLGLDLARRRPDVVAGVALCEGHLHPYADWSELEPGARALFQKLRTPEVGQRLVVGENMFVEEILPAGMIHTMSDAERREYAAPFATPGDRLPILRWIEQIPIGDDPLDVAAIVSANWTTLLQGPLPRLLLHGEPGAVVTAADIERCRREAVGLEIASVGRGTHYLPEDQPAAISDHLRAWLSR